MSIDIVPPLPSYDDVEEGLEAKQDAHELAGQG